MALIVERDRLDAEDGQITVFADCFDAAQKPLFGLQNLQGGWWMGRICDLRAMAACRALSGLHTPKN